VHNGYRYRQTSNSDAAVASVERARIPAEKLVAAIQAVYDAAVEPTNGFGRVPVEDAPTTVIKVSTPAGTREVVVYQPTMVWGELERWVGAEAAAARRKLAAALESAYALNGRGSSYRPSQVEFWRANYMVAGAPQSLTLRTMPKASKLEGCAVLPSVAVPRSASIYSWYRLPDGTRTQAFLRPVLPGEVPCGRFSS
jgi:hypothetical protein